MPVYLPDGYHIRRNNSYNENVVQEFDSPPHIYELALFIAQRAGLKHILNIGYASNEKSKKVTSDIQIINVGFRGAQRISDDMLSNALVICANLLEYLSDPLPTIWHLAEMSNKTPFMLLSTPDRDRQSNWLDIGPPSTPARALEWNASEFVKSLVSEGFSHRALYGYTTGSKHNHSNVNSLLIAGTHVCPSECKLLKVAAIIHCYNEADILKEVVFHLNRQGVKIYVFDNWSNDGSWELANQLKNAGLIELISRFPDKPSDEYQWEKMLRHTERISISLDADWVIHHDADELRYSPWKNMTLQEAISWVDYQGYNAVDFTVIDFRFLQKQSDIHDSYEKSLQNFEFGRRSGHFHQVKAWKNNKMVSLAASGGHNASFEGRKIFPIKFLTKHYPLRTLEQAQKKIFQDRLPRTAKEKAEKGWHIHYDQLIKDGVMTGWDRANLIPWSDNNFNTEFLVPRISGIGLVD